MPVGPPGPGLSLSRRRSARPLASNAARTTATGDGVGRRHAPRQPCARLL